MAIITEFIVGSCQHPERAILKGSRLSSREFPNRAYVISAGQELFLWDAGYSRHFKAPSPGIMPGSGAANPVTLGPEDDLLAQLARRGMRPRDFTAVALSHFHADHVAGLSDFPGLPLRASRKAWKAVGGTAGLHSMLQAHVPGLPDDWACSGAFDVEDLPPISLPEQLQPFDRGHVLSRDHSLVAVMLPGHAPGHLGLFVHTGAGWELLASDAAWDQSDFTPGGRRREISIVIQHDRRAYRETLEALGELSRSGVRVHLSHGPARS